MAFVCLAYHRVADDTAAAVGRLSLSEASFRAQMAWLERRGYRGVTISHALAGRDGARRVALSFDDGYQDFVTIAWPILRQHGFQATLFVVPGMVGGQATWDGGDGSTLMDWPDLDALAAAGIEIGAHGLTHSRLDEMHPEEASKELSEARHIVKLHLGKPPDGVAYPYGCHSRELTWLAAAAGYRWAATARGGRNRGDAQFRMRRTTIPRREWGGWGVIAFSMQVLSGYASWVDLRMDLRRVQG